MFIKGKKHTIEKTFKIIVKKLNKYKLKSFSKLLQLFISFLSFIFKPFIKLKNNKFNTDFLYLLKNKISYGLKFLISKINNKNNNLNFIFYFNNLLTQKKLIYTSIFKIKNLLFFYRW
jgi:hypothetical protein